jgi:hypothetical protein
MSKEKKKNKLLKILRYTAYIIGGILVADICLPGGVKKSVTEPAKRAGQNAIKDLKEEAMRSFDKKDNNRNNQSSKEETCREQRNKEEKVQPTYNKEEKRRNNREFKKYHHHGKKEQSKYK